MPIRTIQKRLPRLGRISTGYQDAKPSKKDPSKLVTFPRRTETLCFHSPDISRLEVIQAKHGGDIRQSPTDAEKWTLVSGTRSIGIHLPPVDDLEAIAPNYLEMWASSGLVRRCDGIQTLAYRLPPEGEEKVGAICTDVCDCICDAKGLEGDDRCKPVIRLSVILADLWADMRGIGVWTVSSAGWGSNSNLAGELDLYRDMLPSLGGSVRFALTVDMVHSKHGDVPTLHLELDHTPNEALALMARGPALEGVTVERPALDEPVGTFTGELADSGAGPSAEQPTRPSDDGSAPESAVVAGIEIPFRGGFQRGDGDRVGAPVALQNNMRKQATQIAEDFDLETAFALFAGFDLATSSLETAQAFADFMRDVLKGKAA